MDYRYIESLTDQQLAAADIADLNLRCAEGLPGSEHLDRREALHKLDKIARQVRRYTDDLRLKFVNYPERCGGTLGRFRMMCLVTVMQRDLGIKYQPELVEGDFDARDSRTQFIHGPLDGYGGTCANLPFLYAAVARRLSYPVFIAKSCGHFFLHYRNEQESFNVEVCGTGYIERPDTDYHDFYGHKLTPEMLATGHFLRPLKPREELAGMYELRGTVLADRLLTDEACFCLGRAFHWHPVYEGKFAKYTELDLLVNALLKKYQMRLPELFRQISTDLSWLNVAYDVLKDCKCFIQIRCQDAAKQHLERLIRLGFDDPSKINHNQSKQKLLPAGIQ